MYFLVSFFFLACSLSFFTLFESKLLSLLFLELMMLCCVWFYLLGVHVVFFSMVFLCGLLVLDSVFCISLLVSSSRDGYLGAKVFSL